MQPEIVQEQVPMASHTTFKTGGNARFFAEVKNQEEISRLLAWAKEKQLPVYLLGGGSNILAPDEGFEGLVLKVMCRGYDVLERGEGVVQVRAGAGEVFDEIVAKTVAAGYWGLENLSHIPGSVGAAPVQNIGAYGTEFSELIEEVKVYNQETGELQVLTNDECLFSYRDSVFKTSEGRKLIILEVTLLVCTEAAPKTAYKDLRHLTAHDITPLVMRDEVIRIRAEKFPDWHTVGTAGSFFKNPIITQEHYEKLSQHYEGLPAFPVDESRVKVPLGWILDKVLGLKGEGTDTVGCYEGQALVLYNKGGATTNDVLAYATWITEEVKRVTEIDIEREVTLLT